jgi:hypothetical protein
MEYETQQVIASHLLTYRLQKSFLERQIENKFPFFSPGSPTMRPRAVGHSAASRLSRNTWIIDYQASIAEDTHPISVRLNLTKRSSVSRAIVG